MNSSKSLEISSPGVDVRQLQELNEVFTRVMGSIFLSPASSPPEGSVFDQLTWTQKKVLFMIETRGPQKMSDLARALSLTLSGATAVVDKMVRLDLLERIPDTTDRRVIRVGLSAAGRELSHECMRLQEQCFREVLERLEPTRRTELLDAFQRIHGLLHELEAGAPATAQSSTKS